MAAFALDPQACAIDRSDDGYVFTMSAPRDLGGGMVVQGRYSDGTFSGGVGVTFQHCASGGGIEAELQSWNEHGSWESPARPEDILRAAIDDPEPLHPCRDRGPDDSGGRQRLADRDCLAGVLRLRRLLPRAARREGALGRLSGHLTAPFVG
jgi:hypothetical protein